MYVADKPLYTYIYHVFAISIIYLSISESAFEEWSINRHIIKLSKGFLFSWLHTTQWILQN